MATAIDHPLLPPIGFVRIKAIVGDAKKYPGIPPIIPVSERVWWSGVASGRYPKPVKLSPGVSAWRVEDIRALLASFGKGAA